jgi:RimJ/RimL family protein N-acetyltransferase
VWAETRTTNLASQRVLTKCGLTYVGEVRRTVLRYERTRVGWPDIA